MSNFHGRVLCPECEYGKFNIEHWDDCTKITCLKCGFVMRELDKSWFEEYPRWNNNTPT